MTPLDLRQVEDFVAQNIGPLFLDRQLAALKKQRLDALLKRKNPYLLRAKQIETAQDYVIAMLDASISSSEETAFGNFMEQVAIFVCQNVYGGQKSSSQGIDLDFTAAGTRYLVAIKSGPSWGNSRQLSKLAADFSMARRTVATSGGGKLPIECIEGCIYGDDNKHKGTSQKMCGQAFWELISGGNKNLYQKIIQPLGAGSRQKTQDFIQEKSRKVNALTGEFLQNYCQNGSIDWNKVLELNSGR